MTPLVYPKWSHTYRLQTFFGGNKGSQFGSSVIVNLVCSCLRFSDKQIILSWCTASVTQVLILQSCNTSKPYFATETLCVAEPLRLINSDILKHG